MDIEILLPLFDLALTPPKAHLVPTKLACASPVGDAADEFTSGGAEGMCVHAPSKTAHASATAFDFIDGRICPGHERNANECGRTADRRRLSRRGRRRVEESQVAWRATGRRRIGGRRSRDVG